MPICYNATMWTTVPQLTHLETAGLLQPAAVPPDGDYLFRHALIQDAAYGSLLKADRRRLHGVIGTILEQAYADRLDDLAPQLGQHFLAAAEYPRAVRYFQRAGELALATYANAEAVAHFTRALEAAQQGPDPVPSGLYQGRARAYAAGGAFDQARADYQTACRLAEAAGDLRAEWQALLHLGMLWAARDYRQTEPYLARALALARTLGDPALLAASLNRLGNWLANVDRPFDALPYHHEALGLLQDLGDRPALAETWDLLGTTALMCGDAIGAVMYYRRAAALFRELADLPGLASSLTMLALRGGSYFIDTLVMPAPRLVTGVPDGEEALRLAHQIAHPAAESFALCLLACCLGPAGHYHRALTLAQRGLAQAQAIDHRYYIGVGHFSLGMLYLDLLVWPAAQQHLEAAQAQAQATHSLFLLTVVTSRLAIVYLRQGDPARAAATLDAVLAGNPSRQLVAVRQAWCAQAEVALGTGRPDRALQIVDALIAGAPPPPRPAPAVIPQLAAVRGAALLALGHLDEAAAVLQAVAAAARLQGAAPLLWRIQRTLATVYAAQGQPATAAQTIAQAHQGVDALARAIPGAAQWTAGPHPLALQAHFRTQAHAYLDAYAR
ncbi:MAG TPA: tetratricopeptide repeat protein [Chloroflexia bacterium]|nr:tetratricopeptide repeat protein [Chloroflexia bacterium]